MRWIYRPDGRLHIGRMIATIVVVTWLQGFFMGIAWGNVL